MENNQDSNTSVQQKAYCVSISTWDCYATIIYATDEAHAEQLAQAEWDAEGPDAFKWCADGDDGFYVEEASPTF